MKLDVQRLHRSLSGLTAHFFNLYNAVENGAFCALAQHHGYPTPLLDWTFSPYVGAYFAYRNLKKSKRTDDHKVRIIMFDAKEWLKLNQIDRFIGVRRHFSLVAPLALNNTRLVPQQAVISISNVDDMERYIEEVEALHYKNYLRVIDLPGSERAQIMQELRMMGITAGSLFPGLDGACEQLREQYFDLWRMSLFLNFRRERAIRRTLRRLARQRVAMVLQPHKYLVIENALPHDEKTDANLQTCKMRGWAEASEESVPAGSLTPQGTLPANFQFERREPIYRLTSAGWSVIHRSHPMTILALVISITSLALSIVFWSVK